MPSLTLHNGNIIPQLGVGTYQLSPEDAVPIVSAAVEMGYRHFDTAQLYHNEAAVGKALNEAIKAGLVKREDLFITTKLNNDFHEPAEVVRSFDQSLKDLGLDYVDLFLIHWPVPKLYDGRYDLTWQTMIDRIYETEKSKAIGVSNFEIHHLERIIDATGFVPHANQIQAHPYFANNELRQFCQSKEIVVEAWAPLARATVLKDPVVEELSQRFEIAPTDLVLGWALARGDVIFPKTSKVARLAENAHCLTIEMPAEAMAAIDQLDKGEAGRYGDHPDKVDFLGR
ncbi:hypothetical protein BK816_08760 [Boudabousia tangfeifanii]|uniref:NADP-dependent oxidoreductase domain-containing protein n=1 Tax=Boudabousia tangfeifanii TaxID=1912795 RepID=A0A1D9MMQ0_9ACTO|nr:hypothetical protein BK816_08760 [Boudabousia tangfeifanii]